MQGIYNCIPEKYSMVKMCAKVLPFCILNILLLLLLLLFIIVVVVVVIVVVVVVVVVVAVNDSVATVIRHLQLCLTGCSEIVVKGLCHDKDSRRNVCGIKTVFVPRGCDPQK
jgi:hypothetical protein